MKKTKGLSKRTKVVDPLSTVELLDTFDPKIAASLQEDEPSDRHKLWSDAARICEEQAMRAFRQRKLETARCLWLRAITSYRASHSQIEIGHGVQNLILNRIRVCSHRFLTTLDARVEILKIGKTRDAFRGHFLPAGSAKKSAVVLCIVAAEHTQEERLAHLAVHARRHGISLLTIDLPLALQSQGHREPEIVTFGKAWVELLTSRPDVDARRIAILGEGLGASVAWQIARADHRFRAAVCDAGSWERRFRKLLLYRTVKKDLPDAKSSSLPSVDLGCPILLMPCDLDYLDQDTLAEISNEVVPGIDSSLVHFLSDSGAVASADSNGSTMKNQYIFGWLARRLEKLR